MPEIRIPLYGMVTFSDLEWAIINTAPFQRLRRVHQLAWSDLVYPGAVHTRFEHSIGVMHLVSRAFDTIVAKPEVRELFESEAANYDRSMWELVRQVLRLTALLHDVGHLPFSHAAENEVFPIVNGRQLRHEDYSAGFILHGEIRELLQKHPDNAGLDIAPEDIAGFLEGKLTNRRLANLAPWRGLISGELDADRMDYLLRDSYHLGVEYGRFDVDRVLSVLTFAADPESGAPHLAVEEGGLLAVEALILARYYMYHQVYFHKVRRFIDSQYATAFAYLLRKNGIEKFAPPDSAENMKAYWKWDDWKTQQGLVEIEDECLEARRVVRRECFKVVLEISSPEQEKLLQEAIAILDGTSIPHYADQHGEATSQKFNTTNILLRSSHPEDPPQPIQYRSQVATGIPSIIFSKRLYVPKEHRQEASRLIEPIRRRLRLELERRGRMATPASLKALAATMQAAAPLAAKGDAA